MNHIPLGVLPVLSNPIVLVGSLETESAPSEGFSGEEDGSTPSKTKTKNF